MSQNKYIAKAREQDEALRASGEKAEGIDKQRRVLLNTLDATLAENARLHEALARAHRPPTGHICAGVPSAD